MDNETAFTHYDRRKPDNRDLLIGEMLSEIRSLRKELECLINDMEEVKSLRQKAAGAWLVATAAGSVLGTGGTVAVLRLIWPAVF